MLVALLAGGGYTLHGALTTKPTPPPASLSSSGDDASPRPSVFAAASPNSSQRASRDEPAPTLALRVTGDNCYIQVETADGTVLIDKTLTRGERWTTDKTPLDVTVGDSGAVEVFVNGERREQGGSGELETFQVSRED